jgi:hypothetical protein
MECPQCGSEIGKARYCGCGWKQGKADPQKSAGVGNCAWLANGEQCHYPGTISHNTVGLGPWYCRFHVTPDISQHYGEQVVRESRNYRQLTIAERDAMHQARLKDPHYKSKFRACEERSCVKSGTLQPNGRYLCYQHKKTPDAIEYVKPKKGNAAERVHMREPGQDDEWMDESLASQA